MIIVFLAVFLFLNGSGLATSNQPQDYQKQIDSLDSKILILNNKVDIALETIKNTAQLAINTINSNTQLIIGLFGVFGVLFAIAAALGIRSAGQLRAIANEARNELEEAKRDMHSANYVVRAIYEMTYAETTSQDTLKKSRLQDAVKMLDAAEGMSGTSSILCNWRAYAYKRLGNIDKALSEAERALNYAKDGEYEKHRALYNKACYCALLGRKEDALKTLSEVLMLRPELKVIARNDDDFITIGLAADDKFKGLVDEH